MTLASEPLLSRRTLPPGARAMTLMRPRALLYSITFRISKVASVPSMLTTTVSFLQHMRHSSLVDEPL